MHKTLAAITVGWMLMMAATAPAALNVDDFRQSDDPDDTRALQAAFDAARKPPYENVRLSGKYKISDTIRMYGLPEGSATIVQTDPEKDIFYIENAYYGTIRNMRFHGGAKQLNLGNNNVDQALMRIENCLFMDSSDFAIYMRQGTTGGRCTHLVITGCKFSKCEQVLHASSDWTTFRDSWITTAWMNNKAAFEHRGAKLLLENVCGVPLVTGREDRWIDNYGSLTCRNFRFGGEFGGMTPVWNFERNTSILLEDCYLGAQGSGRKAVVWCEEIPEKLVIRDSSATVPPLMLSREIELDTYYDHRDAPIISLENSSFGADNGELQRVREAVENRDKTPIKPAGQVSDERTQEMLGQLAKLVAAMPGETTEPAQLDGHVQKTDPKEYVELTRGAVWDLDDVMDATKTMNRELIAVAQVEDDTIFMHRAGEGEGGRWPHALMRNVEIDLDKTPFISWKQKEPPEPFKPQGFPGRDPNAKYKLSDNVRMPMGFGLRITDHATQRMVLLKETHTPPWFDYGAKDLRQLFDVKGGKRIFTVKYYPLGVYIVGGPRSGFAIPGDYQILDFIRAESE